MSKQVTEEMISALIDGELSPADQALVENAISTDESLRRLYESYRDAGVAVKDSAAWVESAVSLPVDFTSRVMSEIQACEAANHDSVGRTSVEEKSPAGLAPVQPANSSVWSVRTLVEIVAAVAAIIVIVVVWQGQGNTNGMNGGTAKQDVDKNDVDNRNPKNGVHALGAKDGKFKSMSIGEEKGEKKDPGAGVGPVSSRKFSVFVNAGVRPSIDRFWILNNYEVTAPEGTDPRGGSQVNVLLIDAKKKDAVEFLSQLKNWDEGFQVFQQAKSGSASWLAPFDVSKVGQAEGDFWTLQIVLINK